MVRKIWRVLVYILWIMGVVIFIKVSITGKPDVQDIWFMASAAFWLASYCFHNIES